MVAPLLTARDAAVVAVLLVLAAVAVGLPAAAVASGGAGVDGLALLAAPALAVGWCAWAAVTSRRP